MTRRIAGKAVELTHRAPAHTIIALPRTTFIARKTSKTIGQTAPKAAGRSIGIAKTGAAFEIRGAKKAVRRAFAACERIGIAELPAAFIIEITEKTIGLTITKAAGAAKGIALPGTTLRAIKTRRSIGLTSKKAADAGKAVALPGTALGAAKTRRSIPLAYLAAAHTIFALRRAALRRILAKKTIGLALAAAIIIGTGRAIAAFVRGKAERALGLAPKIAAIAI